MKIDKDDIKIIAGLIGISLLYYKLITPKKKKEKKSSFMGSPFGKRVLFTIKNTTNQAQKVPLFNSYSNTQNSSVSITPSIAEFNRTLLSDPKKIKAIELRSSGSQSQAEKPIQLMCKDASGEFKSKYLYPRVSAYQVATDMTTVQPKDFVANGQCYMNLTIEPKKTLIATVHYQETKK